MRSIARMGFIVTALLMAAGIRGAAAADELMVSAAGSLTDVMPDLAAAFEQQHRGAKLRLNYASSGTLAAQIERGAPVDVFVSASELDMDRLIRQKLVDAKTRRPIAGNSLVVIVPAESRLKVRGLADLRGNSIKRVGIGDPAINPGGRYAMQAFGALNMADAVRGKCVLGGDIRQVRGYALRGEVDAAVVFVTDANIDGIRVAYRVPDYLHKRILYPAAVVKGSNSAALAAEFVDFLASQEAQRILAKYGFKPAGK